MMHVLHVISELGSGGVEKQLCALHGELPKDKIEFSFVVHGQNSGAAEEYVKNAGCAVYHVTPKKDSLLKNIKEIDSIIKNGKYDVVHVHQNFSSFTALWSAYRHRVPVRIVHSRGCNMNASLKTRIKNAVPGFLNKLFANEFLAISEGAGEWLYGKGWKKYGRLFYDVIDIERFAFSEQKRKAGRDTLGLADRFAVLMVGRFSPEKNHVFALKVFAELIRMHPNSVLLLLGEGKEQDNIKKQAEAMGILDKVRFEGTTDKVEMYMNAADVLIFPSLHEGFGDVAIEAQCAGLPVIASDRIPVDTKATPVIQYLSLNASPVEWAERVLSLRDIERKDYSTCMDKFSLKFGAGEYFDILNKRLYGSEKEC